MSAAPASSCVVALVLVFQMRTVVSEDAEMSVRESRVISSDSTGP
jgi:hypothetical protein